MGSFPGHNDASNPINHPLFRNDFKIKTRTHRLFGLWVAELLGLNVESSEQYVENLLMMDLCQGNESCLLEKAHDDLLERNILVSETHLQNQMDHFWELVTGTNGEKMT